MSLTIIPSYKDGLKELRKNLIEMLPPASLQVFDEDAIGLDNSLENILKLSVNQKAQDFTLNNALNESINLYSRLKHNKLVLVFYRGSWCPYCNLALNQYQSVLREIKKHGAELMAISPQTPDESLSLKEKNNLGFEVLSDNGNLVARLYTTVYKNSDILLTEMKKLGIDFDQFYGDDSKEIPIPAVFIIEKDGSISFAKVEGGDYRNRVEAFEIINRLAHKDD